MAPKERRVVTNTTYSALSRWNTFTENVANKEFDSWSNKDALRGIDRNAILLEALKDEAEMVSMFVFSCTSSEDIINIHEGETKTMKHLGCASCISHAFCPAKEFI